MFILSVKYLKGMDAVDAQLDAHREFLREEYKKGTFIASGPKVPRTGGIVLSLMKDRAELEQILAEDPFCVHQVAEYDITEFSVTMTAPGFEKLKS